MKIAITTIQIKILKNFFMIIFRIFYDDLLFLFSKLLFIIHSLYRLDFHRFSGRYQSGESTQDHKCDHDADSL